MSDEDSWDESEEETPIPQPKSQQTSSTAAASSNTDDSGNGGGGSIKILKRPKDAGRGSGQSSSDNLPKPQSLASKEDEYRRAKERIESKVQALSIQHGHTTAPAQQGGVDERKRIEVTDPVLAVGRQPKGPDGTKGFHKGARQGE